MSFGECTKPPGPAMGALSGAGSGSLYLPHHGTDLHRLVYVSHVAQEFDPDGPERGLDEIVASSSARNRARGVTGSLLLCGSRFLQVLEGSADVLRPLYERIEADGRHRDVTIKSVEAISGRLFSRWGMRRTQPPPGLAGVDLDRHSGADLLQVLRISALQSAGSAR